MKDFFLGFLLCAGLWVAVSAFGLFSIDTITDDPLPTELNLSEIKGANRLILATQIYQESCWYEDGIPNVHFGKATFQWTQEFGFGVDFKDGDPKLTTDGDGNYTLNLPALQQLHPIEKGFSRIEFPLFLSAELMGAYTAPENNTFAKKLQAVRKVIRDTLEVISIDEGIERLRMPSPVELQRMMGVVRDIADTRTELASQFVLSNDGVLIDIPSEDENAVTIETKEGVLLSDIAATEAAMSLGQIITDMINVQTAQNPDGGLVLNGVAALPLQKLSIEFEPYDGQPTTYEHKPRCADSV